MINQTDNKRIAKNTLLLYFRMLVLMVLSLFTSRITLAALGVVDFGVYNVIGGMVAMFSIISGAITVAIGRYITVEIGRNDKTRQNIVFSTSVIIQMMMAVVIIIVAEIAGIWFLNNKMVIPADRLFAANWVLQCSILTFVLNLVSVPYNAVIIAHEKMSAFAYITILDVVFKLIFVYTLYITPSDKLITYAVLLAFWAVVMRLIYGSYCSRHFEEAHFKWIFDKKLIREMMGFVGWAFWGNGVVVLKDQGANVLLNLFCGPAVNAARGVAMQVNNAVYSFVTNFLTAVNPQITKSYAQKDYSSMNGLIMKGTKFSFFIMMILILPLCANINYVLSLWLVEVPEHTANFIVLTLLFSMLECFGQPILTGVLAEGNIKKYEIVLTILYFSNFVGSYIVLKMGMAPESVFVLNIIFKILVNLALLIHARSKFYFPAREYMKGSLIPTLLPFSICGALIYLLPVTNATDISQFILDSLSIFCLSITTIYILGINKRESAYIMTMIKNKTKRKNE